MPSPIEEIKELVSQSQTSDALSRLLDMSQQDKQLHDSIRILSGEFRELNQQKMRGTIESSQATLRLNVIHDKILTALEAFDSQGRVLPGVWWGGNLLPQIYWGN